LLDYNLEGLYFDETHIVVYDKDGVLVYGIFALAFIFLGIISLIISLTQSRKSTKTF